MPVCVHCRACVGVLTRKGHLKACGACCEPIMELLVCAGRVCNRHVYVGSLGVIGETPVCN